MEEDVKRKNGSSNIYDLIKESKNQGISLDKMVKQESKKAGFLKGKKLRKKLTEEIYAEFIYLIGILQDLDPSSPEARIIVENAEILSNCYERLTRTYHEIVVAVIKGIAGGFTVVIGILLCGWQENKGIGFVGPGKYFWPKPKMD